MEWPVKYFLLSMPKRWFGIDTKKCLPGNVPKYDEDHRDIQYFSKTTGRKLSPDYCICTAVPQFDRSYMEVDQRAVDLMGLEKDDLFDEVEDIVGAMEFMEMSEDAQVIFI